jgi:hypothetical protein
MRSGPIFTAFSSFPKTVRDDITAILRCRKSELISKVGDRGAQRLRSSVGRGSSCNVGLDGVDRLLDRRPISQETNELPVENRVGDQSAAEPFN